MPPWRAWATLPRPRAHRYFSAALLELLASEDATTERGAATDGSAADASYGALGHDLFRALLPESIWSLVRPREVVHLVADGPLANLPMDSLVVTPGDSASTARFVLDEGPVFAYHASLGIREWLGRRAKDAAPGERRRAVLVGAPDTDWTRAPGDLGLGPLDDLVRQHDLARLPDSEREVAESAARLESSFEVRQLLGRGATPERVLQESADAELLHIASHHLNLRVGDRTYRALALSRPDTTGNGLLMLGKLVDSKARLSGRCVVVLHACGSARAGRTRVGAGWSLPIGFFASGAAAVIGGAWVIRDDVGAAFARQLYEHPSWQNRSGRRDLAAAFRAAKAAIRKTHPEPFFWGGIQWFGDMALPRNAR